jgi:hypothetical protein
MYNNTDNTTYATVTNSRTSTSSYYIYIRGFNFDDVPSTAIVNSISIKIKAYHSGGNTSTIYAYDGTTQVSAAGSTTALSTSATVKTFTNTTLEWDTLKGYGSDFGIRINCRRSSRNTTSRIYIYGAEIVIDYTLPISRTITTSLNGSGTISPSGTTTVYDGDNFILTINTINPTVIDNNVDVTSQLERITSGTETFIPYDYESSGFTISNIQNAYTDINDSTYANCDAPAGGTTSSLYLELGPIDIPSTATISSVSCQASLQISRNSSSSGMNASCQMYSGDTAKGSATTLATSATDVARTTYTLSVGSWTAAELQNARFHISFTNNASSTHRYVYVYGIALTVTYSVSGEVYIYTINNVTGDHTIVVTTGTSQTKIFVKQNGTWAQYSKVYKKVNGSWVEQSSSTWSTLFNTDTNYRKMN